MPSSNLKLKVILKVSQENKAHEACSNSVTIYSEMNVTTCPDSVSLIKHAIVRNALQILFNGLSKICHIILITTSINQKAEKHELWIYILLPLAIEKVENSVFIS